MYTQNCRFKESVKRKVEKSIDPL